MAKNYLLSKEEIERETQEILDMIKNNEFPRMVMKNNGTKRRALTSKELELSADLVNDRIHTEDERQL